MSKTKTKSYVDVTKEWLESATPNSHDIVLQSYYEHNDVKYFVDGKYIIYDNSKIELETADWLKQKLGGSVIILPRINYPKNIKTPDYLFRGEKFDLKNITGSNRTIVYTNLRSNKNQSNNFIIDISKTKLSVKAIQKQIKHLYITKKFKWINIIILKKGRDIVCIYKRK